MRSWSGAGLRSAGVLFAFAMIGGQTTAAATDGGAATRPPATGPAGAGRYLVTLRNAVARAGRVTILSAPGSPFGHVPVDRAISRIVRPLGIHPIQRYTHALAGFAAELTPGQVVALRMDPSVAFVEPDEPTSLDDPDGVGGGVRTTRLAHQVIPTGVRRVQADRSPLARIDGVDDRINADVAIIDTGIAPHPDLNIAGGHDCTSGNPTAWRDRYGHGTHVAGIVGAKDNGIGVVGVAPGVRLWALKALSDDGRGYISWYVCAIDWMVGQRDPSDPSRPRFEVANMSFDAWLPFHDDRDCGLTNGDVLHQAVCAAVADGTTMVAAAGNDSMNAALREPGAFDEVITVSALADFDGKPGGVGRQAAICPWYSPERDDTFASFSNFGPDVDLIAPGKCILSTYLHGLYAWETGTSMAAPHVTGAVALLAAANPGARPDQIRQALRAAATFNWLTHTDPDHHPDPLLDVAPLGPLPDFSIAVDAPGPAELGPGGTLELPVQVNRVHGDTAPVALSLSGLPSGVDGTFSPATVHGSGALLTLFATSNAAEQALSINVQATDGVAVRQTTVGLNVVDRGVRIVFSEPAVGTTSVRADGQATIAFQETDASDPPVARDLLRERATPSQPGSCDGAAWLADGSAESVATADPGGSLVGGWSITQTDLARDGCDHWLVRLTFADGSTEAWASAAVIEDATPPSRPVVRGFGPGVAQGAPNGVIWIRGRGPGTLHLTATGADAASGVQEHQFGALSESKGWSEPPGTVSGDPSDLTLTWQRDAVGTTFTVRAVDRAGNVGPARTVVIRVDRRAPVAPRWTSPPSGTLTISGHVPILEWSRGRDNGSGFAALQLVGQQRATLRRPGTCAGAHWVSDGPARLLPIHFEERHLQTHTCYRWILTALDRVGNHGRRVVSGWYLFDDTPPAINFLSPNEGSFAEVSATSVLVRWTERETGGSGAIVARALERERGVPVTAGTCDGVRWAPDGPAVTRASPLTSRGLVAGFCYRWRQNVVDRAGNVGVEISGAILVDTSP